MLLKRVITAVILIPLVVLGIFKATPIWFASVVGVIALLMAVEWWQLCKFKNVFGLIVMLLCYVATGLGAWFYADRIFIPLNIVAVVWWCLAFLFLLFFPRGLTAIWKFNLVKLVIGWLMIFPMWFALCTFNGGLPPVHLLYVLVIIWTADSGAYFAGRAFGKHKLAPKVSPAKSWEGLLGGLLASLLVAYIFAVFVPGSSVTDWGRYFAVTVFIVIVSLIGDLTESMFKRLQDVKDSGKFLPGHGGLLDRLDSVMAAAPLLIALYAALP